VVTTRSVLIYVKDKAAALREFYRVLGPGGRVSLFEPINRLMADQPGWFAGYDARPVAALVHKVLTVYEAIQPLGSDPMLDFDERDLVSHAESAGFPEIGLELRLSLKASKRPCSWETFLRSSGNPLIPPLGEVMDQTLTATESAAFTVTLKPLVESGRGRDRAVVAYLTAMKN
jgi:arsenite methyltransferase